MAARARGGGADAAQARPPAAAETAVAERVHAIVTSTAPDLAP
ncbi:hypothetical protein [Marinitenerispora sediminis]|nr:hypothetical protein [Marinitenerispora sediminis]